MAKVVAVCTSKKKGTRKQPIAEGQFKEEHGLVGDAHAGVLPNRQVSLLALESIDKMRGLGLELHPGDFAENITTAGLDLPSLPVGTVLLLGTSAVGVVSQIGKECLEPCAIGRQLGDCVMPREGIFLRVVQPGKLRPGDLIQVLGD